jgi:hypothetical protein
MSKYTFKQTEITGKYGHHYPLLTSNEFPWMNCQVIPMDPDERATIMAELRARQEYVVHAAGREDFCVIQAGGGTPEHPTIEITADNADAVDRAICECMQAAADFWAANH